MKFNLVSLVSVLESLPGIIETYISNIPEYQLDIRRNEEAWTIREHVYHIADVQKLLYDRIELLKTVTNPVITPFFPETQKSMSELYSSIEEAFSTYYAGRKKQIELIHTLNTADFNNEAHHKEYGMYTIPLIMNHMISHEYWHMYRIEEIWLTTDEYFK